LRKHQLAVEKSLGVKASNAISHLIPPSQIPDVYILIHEIPTLKNLPKVKFYPDLTSAELLTYYSEKISIKNRKCIAPFLGAVVKPNGDVVFCPDEWINDYVLGNVRNTNFIDIWNGAKACKFREVLFTHGSFPGCKRCCWMYLF
jgi:radical SAM protein with 4Fe4S-binding SPASM domain